MSQCKIAFDIFPKSNHRDDLAHTGIEPDCRMKQMAQ